MFCEQYLSGFFKRADSSVHSFRWNPGDINCSFGRTDRIVHYNIFLNGNRLLNDGHGSIIVLFLCGQFQSLHSICRLEHDSNNHLQIGNSVRSSLFFWNRSLFHGCRLLLYWGPVGINRFKDERFYHIVRFWNFWVLSIIACQSLRFWLKCWLQVYVLVQKRKLKLKQTNKSKRTISSIYDLFKYLIGFNFIDSISF